jgi:TIR domain
VRVFLSYRRGDAAGYAGRLTDTLIQRLGPRGVFQDVSAISPGQDFTAAIDRALAESDAALVVIGPDWLRAETPEGTRRLLEADDYVRLEVSRALTTDIRVIPILVGGARLPAAAELPDDLQELTQRQALELRDGTWHRDVDGLVRSLRGQSDIPPDRHRRWLLVGISLVALLALGAGSWWLWGPGTGAQSGSTAAPPPCAPPASQEWTPVGLNQNPTAVDTGSASGSLVFRVKKAYWRPHDGKWQVILSTTLENRTPQTISIGDWRYGHLDVAKRPFNVTCFSPTNDTLDPNLLDDELVGYDVACKPAGYMQLEVEGGRISVTPATLDWGSC